MTRLVTLAAGLALLTSCGLFERTDCVQMCKDFYTVTQASPNGPNREDHDARCELLDTGSCTDCWHQISLMFEREYRTLPECYCVVDENDRDPDIEGGFGTGSCDGEVDAHYDGDYAGLEAACECDGW